MIWGLLGAWVLMNAVGFFIMGADKRRAKKNLYRIEEKTLWLVAIFGGALGTTFGMNFYRHKTKHVQFKYGLPVLSFIETVIYLYLFYSHLN